MPLSNVVIDLYHGDAVDALSGFHDIKADGIKAVIHKEDGAQIEINLISRIDTLNELDYYKNDGILQHVLRNMLKI